MMTHYQTCIALWRFLGILLVLHVALVIVDGLTGRGSGDRIEVGWPHIWCTAPILIL